MHDLECFLKLSSIFYLLLGQNYKEKQGDTPTNYKEKQGGHL